MIGESGRGRVVMVTIYFSDVANWNHVYQIDTDFLAEHRPARAAVLVGPLHFVFQVDVEAVAEVA